MALALPGITCFGMSAAMSLEGVASEWEDTAEVRERLRMKKVLFVPAARDIEARCTLACAECNFHILAPLAKRLQMPDGKLGQLRIPEIKKQPPD